MARLRYKSQTHENRKFRIVAVAEMNKTDRDLLYVAYHRTNIFHPCSYKEFTRSLLLNGARNLLGLDKYDNIT